MILKPYINSKKQLTTYILSQDLVKTNQTLYNLFLSFKEIHWFYFTLIKYLSLFKDVLFYFRDYIFSNNYLFNLISGLKHPREMDFPYFRFFIFIFQSSARSSRQGARIMSLVKMVTRVKWKLYDVLLLIILSLLFLINHGSAHSKICSHRHPLPHEVRRFLKFLLFDVL